MKIIYAIPGLNTTKELFRYLKLPGVELRVLDWPLLDENETMSSLAAKMAGKIDETRPFYLMGVSFGGMLCIEIAKIRKPQRIFLISSCKCRKELPLVVRLFKYVPVYKWIPESQIKFMIKNSRRILGFDKSFVAEFHQMIDSMEPNYFRRSINCIVNWNEGNCSNTETIHIHGTADKLIRYKNVKADHKITGGSHAMIVNRAKEISLILNEKLR